MIYWIKGVNFMTPNMISTAVTNNYVIELSWGEGISRDKVYGVSVYKRPTTGYMATEGTELSRCFHSKREAKEYMNWIISDDGGRIPG